MSLIADIQVLLKDIEEILERRGFDSNFEIGNELPSPIELDLSECLDDVNEDGSETKLKSESENFLARDQIDFCQKKMGEGYEKDVKKDLVVQYQGEIESGVEMKIKNVNFENLAQKNITKEKIAISDQVNGELVGLRQCIVVKVFLLNTSDFIELEVSKKITFHQLIMTLIKTHNSSDSAAYTLKENADAYNIAISNKVGEVDDMYPILSRESVVENWMDVPFVLLENPDWKSQSSYYDKNSGGERVFVKVTLPSGAYHTLLMDSQTKVGKILRLICKKRNLFYSDYVLRTTSDSNYLNWNVRLSELYDYNLTLTKRDNLDIFYLTRPRETGEFYWYENLVIESKKYNDVIYYQKNKLFSGGLKKQDVSLLIDRKGIVILFAKNLKNSIVWKIKHLKSISQMEGSPNTIVVDTTKEKIYFELLNNAIVQEVIGKISFLINAYKEISN